MSSRRTRQNGFEGNGVRTLLGKPATECSVSANRASQRSRNTSPNRKNITGSIHFRRSSWRSSRRTTWNTTKDTFGTNFFRPAGACQLSLLTHGSRRGLHSYAAPRLQPSMNGRKAATENSPRRKPWVRKPQTDKPQRGERRLAAISHATEPRIRPRPRREPTLPSSRTETKERLVCPWISSLSPDFCHNASLVCFSTRGTP